MVQEFYCVQMRESGFSSHYYFVLGKGAPAGRQESKKCDKQLTFIVRVRLAFFIFCHDDIDVTVYR
jgi:hypothetical protein